MRSGAGLSPLEPLELAAKGFFGLEIESREAPRLLVRLAELVQGIHVAPLEAGAAEDARIAPARHAAPKGESSGAHAGRKTAAERIRKP